MNAKKIKMQTGSRKTARAVVMWTKNSDQIINNISLKAYFKEERFVEDILRPFKVLELNVGFKARVRGGGISAQSAALRYALSKLLAGENTEVRKKLKANALLSGDPRSVERKKVGLYKARAKYPFNRR